MASSTIVLVPGAWHLPACLNQLRDELMSLGLDSVAVTHPSVGSTSQPPKTMTDDRANLHAVIKKLADDGHLVTVIAHSYGGVVSSGAAQGLGLAERRAAGKSGGIIKIVYLAAFAVPAGMSIFTYFGGVAPSFWEFKGDQTYANDPEISNPANLFYNDLPRDVQDYWISQLLPTTTESFKVPNTYEPWKGIPCTYIHAEQDMALPLKIQKAMVAGMGPITTASLDSSHSPFLSMPREVAALVQESVREGLEKASSITVA
ncbi:alpha/beta-hydrolase [Aspergillus sclerotioniger CBS 115572]|uniref:Alpha/beta-hydrolase n=1 Tax=Aspergillus sclerotioniger CBS 115572 TaxID=1450535 RepID=A0A317X2G6_9EURO|nr:alpha/beta-hydrolase [Aspergillus sclerotioniger CBS 115572]PWY91687.1 alpha/beta-hydrolase [Aspergillus sclerotioniger CBS 115572]